MIPMTYRPKILAVDDEVFVLDILEDDLVEAGFDVVRAENGAVAMVKLKAMGQCDAVILDRMMPVMDGMSMLRQMKAAPEYKDIPVIVQTADGQQDHIKEGISEGAYCYLVKPYNEEILITTVKAAMGMGEKSVH